MTVTIDDLIKNKEKIKNKKNEKYDIETSIGTITVRKLSLQEVADFLELENTDIQVVYETVVQPNLKDKELQKAYECTEPTDIVTKLFEGMEITQISKKVAEISGAKELKVKLHEEIKKPYTTPKKGNY